MRFGMRWTAAAFGLVLASGTASAYPSHPTTDPEMTKTDIAVRDKAISDDSFQGRGPGTTAGEASAQWIADELKRIGVAPGNRGSYFQDVPSVVIALDPAKSKLTFRTAKGAMTPKFPDEAVYWTPHYAGTEVEIADAPLVFVGYGVVAPEFGWDDYAGIDVKGKTVVILINDPGNEDAHPDPKFFEGRAMTYYGRWDYKFEEAARHGAAAAIIVHETEPAAYGWQVVRNSNSGDISWLLSRDKNASLVPIHGWITLDTAKELFARAGLDYTAMKRAANRRGFKAVAMKGESLDVDACSAFKFLTTRNVVGLVTGAKRPNEYVVYSAHWDHLGIKPDVAGPDKIYNGAVDNGMGVSMVLDIAEKFAHDAAKPDRSVVFLFETLEEQGLLGAAYFAQHPIFPLAQTVGDFNLDADHPAGMTKDMNLPGYGSSELQDYLVAALKAQGRILSPDPEPEKGGAFRADHFAFAKLGVPAITPSTGTELVEGGKAAAQAIRDDYVKNHYHQPADEFDPKWDMTAPLADEEALYAAGKALANSTAWPDWKAGSPFKPVRDAMTKKAD
jgi:Zn-dependent M28 family amino/carboxypeptidase